MGRPRKSDDLIIQGLVHGMTYVEVGNLAGVGVRTIGRRLQDPDFVARLNQARAEQTAADAAKLAALAFKAIDVLDDAMDEADPRIRVRAAQLVLKIGPEFRDRTEFEGRLRALEGGTAP